MDSAGNTAFELPGWEQLPQYTRERWHKLAIELPIPPDAGHSGSGRKRLYELGPDEWEARISRDPVLSGKVLAVANSAAMGQSRRITSVARAVVLLGQNILQAILYAYHLEGVIGRFPDYPRSLFDYIRRWCAASAACGLHLARAAGEEDPPLIGTAALLARLGSLVLGLNWPPPGPEYLDFRDELSRLRYELERFKVASCHLTHAVTSHWNLPDELVWLASGHSLAVAEELDSGASTRQAALTGLAVALGASVAGTSGLDEALLARPEYSVLAGNVARLKLDHALTQAVHGEGLQRDLAALLE
jgi:HD-like signal output (HDOD) protein